jgi:hypothetical protein
MINFVLITIALIISGIKIEWNKTVQAATFLTHPERGILFLVILYFLKHY